jgi:hypothetical protein
MTFDIDALQAEARERSGGLADFGDPAFRPALAALLRALDHEARLSDTGRRLLGGRIVELLRNRLMLEDSIRRHPEILAERIDDPIVIVGLARSGTTFLQRILSCDPRMYPLLWWETRFPVPHTDGILAGEDPRIGLARAEVRMMLEANPALLAIHPWDAEAADEEGMLMEHSFMSFFDAYADIPGYTDWLWANDQAPAYRHLRRMLQFLQWQKRQRGVSANRWVLKTPHHLRQIDMLFRVFPDVQVIQTHRDPLETIPSIASFVWNLWTVYLENADPVRAGQQWSAIAARGLRGTMAHRAGPAGARFHDVWFADTLREPLAVIRSIYDFVGLGLPGDVQERMLAGVEHNRREQRPVHSYSPAHFGLSEEQITREFAAYREKYIKPA